MDTTKKTSIITLDLKVNRNVNIKIKTIDVEDPQVLEINFSGYIIPKTKKDPSEYEKSIERISKKFRYLCKKYVRENENTLYNKYIIANTLTAANLKQGYNKYITISFYVQQRNNLNFERIKNRIKETIKDMSFVLTDTIHEEGYKTYKSKQ